MTRLLVMLALMFSTPGATGTIQRNGTYNIVIPPRPVNHGRIAPRRRYHGRLTPNPRITVRVWEDGSYRINGVAGCLPHGLCVD